MKKLVLIYSMSIKRLNKVKMKYRNLILIIMIKYIKIKNNYLIEIKMILLNKKVN